MYERIVLKSNENICNITAFTRKFFKKEIASGKLFISNGRIIIEKECFKQASKTFTEFIIRDYVFFLVSLYVYECDFEFTNSNRHYIVGKILEQFFSGEDICIRDSVEGKLVYFAEKFSTVSIDGFIRFSMREYDNIVLDLADIFIDEILCNS